MKKISPYLYLLTIFFIEAVIYTLVFSVVLIFEENLSFWLFVMPFFFLWVKIIIEGWLVIIISIITAKKKSEKITKENIINSRIITSYAALFVIFVASIFESNKVSESIGIIIYVSFIYIVPVILALKIVFKYLKKHKKSFNYAGLPALRGLSKGYRLFRAR